MMNTYIASISKIALAVRLVILINAVIIAIGIHNNSPFAVMIGYIY